MSALHGLQARIEDFEAKGVRVIAISPDSVEENQDVVRKHGLSFPILSDIDLKATKALGLLHEGGGMSAERPDIPRPAVFIARGGKILWRGLTDNWRVRVRAENLLTQLSETLGR